MTFPRLIINALVAAVLCGIPVVASAQSTVDDLLDRLANPDLRNWSVVEEEVRQRWSISGSATADYLLRRGQEALEVEDYDAAYDHLTALVDHAPEFAEGWNARATMFFMQQMYGPAIADLQRVLALEPRHFEALTGLGIMLEDMGDQDRALQAYEAAHAIHPQQPDILRLVEDLRVQLEGEAL
ncbi:tetratricopeptide repeat protein [Gymnodinialimonas sp. 2305UL16-5]|uniref:tetratricopeptide repeat protein n=1 Tax=Gymnodinialimonas mytili TaxID=3126503 RepID=UPI0030AC9A9F